MHKKTNERIVGGLQGVIDGWALRLIIDYFNFVRTSTTPLSNFY